jgi:hypothetical protein
LTGLSKGVSLLVFRSFSLYAGSVIRNSTINNDAGDRAEFMHVGINRQLNRESERIPRRSLSRFNSHRLIGKRQYPGFHHHPQEMTQ